MQTCRFSVIADQTLPYSQDEQERQYNYYDVEVNRRPSVAHAETHTGTAVLGAVINTTSVTLAHTESWMVDQEIVGI